MLGRLAHVTLFILCCVAAADAQEDDSPEAPQDEQTSRVPRDPAVWAWLGLSTPLIAQVDLSLSGFLNIHEGSTRVLLLQTPVKLSRSIAFVPGYLYLRTLVAGDPYHEHQLRGGVVFRISLGPFILDNRNLMVQRLRPDRTDVTRYRNRLRLTFPLTSAGLPARILLWDEVFYDWGVERWTRNSLALGIAVDFMKCCSGQLSHQWESVRAREEANLVFVGLRARFALSGSGS